MNIRAGDLVVVISGKYKGKTGSVLRLLPTKNRVVVAGLNMRTKHVKATPQAPGQIVKYEASVHRSNVMLVDPKTKKRTRVGYKVDAKGVKQRIAKRSGEVIETVKAAKKVRATKADGAAEKKTSKKTENEATASGPSKQPFWKRIGFGADALEEDGSKGSNTQPNHPTTHAHKTQTRAPKGDS